MSFIVFREKVGIRNVRLDLEPFSLDFRSPVMSVLLDCSDGPTVF